MKLALHRSATFWSGILVIAFIGWAWRDSMRYHAWLDQSGIAVSNIEGGIIFDHATTGRGPGYNPKFKCARHELQPSDLPRIRALPGPRFFGGGGGNFAEMSAHFGDTERAMTFLEISQFDLKFRPREDWRIFIPHWLVLVAVAPAWIALLLLRARRRRVVEKNPELFPA